jgi:hypothetical protein
MKHVIGMSKTKVKRQVTLAVLSILVMSLFVNVMYAATPHEINFQGRLLEDGNPADGDKAMTFKFYNAVTGGDQLGTTFSGNVVVSSGVFNVIIGSVTPSVFTSTPNVWIEITVDGGAPLSPRQKIVSVGYAFEADKLDGHDYDAFVDTTTTQNISGKKIILSDLTISTNVYVSGKVGIGITNPLSKLQVNGAIYGNSSKTNTIFDGSPSTDNANFIGSDGYWAFRSAINNSFNIDVYNSASPKTALTVLQDGKVGIGTTNPSGLFQVGGGTLTVMSSGNVGIGTTSPSDTLEVNGGITSTYGFYHDRGDTASDYDWTLANLTADGVWRDLPSGNNGTLASIVPAGAKAVVFAVVVYDDVTVNVLALRKNGYGTNTVAGYIYTQTANVTNQAHVIVACDENRVIEYKVGSGMAYCSITVQGWWK